MRHCSQNPTDLRSIWHGVGTGDNPGDGHDHHGHHHPTTASAVGNKGELDEVFPGEHAADPGRKDVGAWKRIRLRGDYSVFYGQQRLE
jgi:hypothetical protein